MITIEAVDTKEKFLFRATGHANSRAADQEYDLVCNTVSVATQQILMGLIKVSEKDVKVVKYEYGYMDFECNITKENKLEFMTLINCLLNFIREVEEEYKKYVKVEVTE